MSGFIPFYNLIGVLEHKGDIEKDYRKCQFKVLWKVKHTLSKSNLCK